MKKSLKFGLILFTLLLGFLSCNLNTNSDNEQGEWIKGSKAEKIKTIERQFRGFDMAMVETGYRYQELYWAGQDENWDYAKYQTEKIRTAIENGVQRRPKRQESALFFLDNILPKMMQAIETKDRVVFNTNFNIVRAECNNCHIKESVPFIQTVIPQAQVSLIKFENEYLEKNNSYR
ncbi:MAG: hypothetical protein M3Q58_06205 [Bacteroidota bacterium]|nr:hypothetical protein [Bacteroidota bacterium]